MIDQIKLWISKAVPAPTEKNMSVQLGCHFEEVAEMLEALGLNAQADLLHDTATAFKENRQEYTVNRQELLDALADQVVTGTGVAHMFKLDLLGACAEVNASNWSKFVNGEPVFDANGKVAKGPGYFKPDLTKFV
jgi:hypothetical protein